MAVIAPEVTVMATFGFNLSCVAIFIWISTRSKNVEMLIDNKRPRHIAKMAKLNWINAVFEDLKLEQEFKQFQRENYLNTTLWMCGIFFICFPIIRFIFTFSISTSNEYIYLKFGDLSASEQRRIIAVWVIRGGHKILIGLACLISAYGEKWKKFVTKENYTWIQDIVLPCWIYVFYHFVAVSTTIKSVMCSTGYEFIDMYSTKCLTISYSQNYSNDLYHAQVNPDFVKKALANKMALTQQIKIDNITYIDKTIYKHARLYDNTILFPWLYGWNLLYKQYIAYLYYLVLPLLGLATFDLNLKCCCGARKRIGYRFCLIPVFLSSSLNVALLRKVC